MTRFSLKNFIKIQEHTGVIDLTILAINITEQSCPCTYHINLEKSEINICYSSGYLAQL